MTSSSIGRRALFASYARSNYWADTDSVSGPGSSLAQTAVIRAALPPLFERLAIRSLLDIPCGDGHWIRQMDHSLERYIGADVVKRLVEDLQATARPDEEFHHLDALIDPLPRADAILSRDFLVHLSDAHVRQAVVNLQRSGATFLLATTYPGQPYRPIQTGDWRPLDLQGEPICLPPPIELIREGSAEQGGAQPDKALGVWALRSLRPT